MASKTLSDLQGGGGGLLATSSYTGGSVGSGTSGDVTISCPSGKYLRLTLLYSDSTLGGLTISFGSRLIATGSVRRPDQYNILGLNIGNAPQGTGDNGSSLQYIQGKKDENLVFNFSSSTTTSLRYMYEVLEDA